MGAISFANFRINSCASVLKYAIVTIAICNSNMYNEFSVNEKIIED